MEDTPRTAALRRYKEAVQNAEAVLNQIAYEGHIDDMPHQTCALHLRNARGYAPDPDIILDGLRRDLA